MRVFRVQGIGSFLLHLTQRFGLLPPSDLHPFRHDDGGPGSPSADSLLYSLFTSSARIIRTFRFRGPLYRGIIPHLSLVTLSSLSPFPCYSFRLILSLLFFFCLFYHATMYISVLFTTLSYWLCCFLAHPSPFFSSPFSSLSFSSFSSLKLSSLIHSNFLTLIFSFPFQTISPSVSLTLLSIPLLTYARYFARSSFFYRGFLAFFLSSISLFSL